MALPSFSCILLLFGLLHITGLGVESVGVCYGRNGQNLPKATDVINLYKNNRIKGIRVYDPNPEVLDALKGSNIDVILDVPNDKLRDLNDPSRAQDWVQNNIVRYSDVNFKYVAVGNEVYAGNPQTAQYVDNVLPALRNVHDALSASGLQDSVRASTATYSTVLSNTYPPRDSVFQDDANGLMGPTIKYLAQNNLPLLANIYPYFSHRDNSGQITQSYALFTQPDPNEAGYQNLFDALLDSMYAAVQKAGGPDVPIVVSESGWPSEGGFAASLENAGTYYKNLIEHVKGDSGTPMKPGRSIETYLFAMFDENLKQGDEVEKHFGLFRPDGSPKYQLSFN